MTTQSYEEMTPKDDLVERVAQKIGAALRDGEQLDGATRAAIAAYFDAGEVHTERAAISLADKYEEKIAKLGADLIAWRSAFQDVTPGGSEFMHPQSVRDYARKLKDETVQAKLDRARIQKDFAKLEAEAAAMRGAIQGTLGDIVPDPNTPPDSRRIISHGDIMALCAALSPDAGKRVRDVIEAANLFVHARNSETFDELINALVALEEKP